MKQKIVSIVKMVTFVKPFNALVKLPWPMKKHLMLVLLATSSIVYGKTYYVATNGKDSNNGTSLSTPFATWQRGINAAYPGDTVYVRGGIYFLAGNNPFVEINPQAWPTPKGRSGTKAKPICFWAYPPDYESGNIPILDCSKAYETYGTNFSCFGLNAVEYWHIKGITVRNAFQRGNANRRPQGFGATLSANLKFENCTAHNISARGFYYESGAWNTWDGPNALWSSDTTYFINCDAYDIRDSVNCSSGDGWKCGNYYGGVLIFDGCRAWDYSDDGFDPGGAGKRIIRNCWAMSGNKYSSLCSGNIEGNGFKTAAVGVDQDNHYPLGYVFVEMTNCLAAYCIGYGFYNNLELGRDNNARYFNNTAYRNHGGFFDMPLNTSSRGLETRNNISFNNRNSDYSQVGIYKPSIYVESNNTWKSTQQVNDWPGWIKNPAVTVTDADFISLDASQLKYPRKPDGSLPDITFLKLAAGSDLIDAGIDVGLPYSGSAPDLGYAEYGSVPPTPSVPTFVSASIQNASPDKLEMTYSLSLAAIVPANSAFIVKVNGQTRTVNAVTVAGNKVTLKLASPVAFGQEVTVAYNKPATYPLQTPQGGQVATMTARNVINNVAETPNQPPLVSISSPTKNTGYIAPATITIEANATDSDGTITKVEFYNGQVKLGEVTKAPYLFKWNNVSDGGYQITAVATDNKNAKTVSSPVTVVVNKPASKINQPPFVRITNPDKGETFKRNESIILEAEALDPDGTISKIEFRIGNEVVAELSEAPWVFNWQNADTGQYVITVIATDNLGAVSQSAEVAFTVYEDKIPGFTMLNLYPNPNNGHFTVEMAKEIDSERLYTVFSLSGKVLHNEKRDGHEVITEFNLIELPSGTYILTVSSDNKIIESRKFIKR